MTDERNNSSPGYGEDVFDERQKQIRTKCFAHAYFVTPAVFIADMLLRTSVDGVVWFDPDISWLVCLELTMMLAAMEMDWRDALTPPKEKDRLWEWLILLVLTAFGVVLQWNALLRNEQRYGIPLIKDGYLDYGFTRIFTSVMWLVFCASHLCRLAVLRIRRRKDPDDDGER